MLQKVFEVWYLKRNLGLNKIFLGSLVSSSFNTLSSFINTFSLRTLRRNGLPLGWFGEQGYPHASLCTIVTPGTSQWWPPEQQPWLLRVFSLWIYMVKSVSWLQCDSVVGFYCPLAIVGYSAPLLRATSPTAGASTQVTSLILVSSVMKWRCCIAPRILASCPPNLLTAHRKFLGTHILWDCTNSLCVWTLFYGLYMTFKWICDSQILKNCWRKMTFSIWPSHFLSLKNKISTVPRIFFLRSITM